MTWKVKFFQTARRKYPVKDFAEKQTKATFAKIIRSVELLENYGPFIKPPYAKKIQNKLYELRIPGKDAIRIFYTMVNEAYFLLHAFKKKSQKIPKREVKTAVDRMKEII
jgi:phage-related protein